MENYLYFRKATTLATEDDEETGSTVYPVSALQGICSGTAATTTGAVTDDPDAFTMFFKRKAAGPTGGEDEAASDNVDMVIVAITTDNNQRDVIQSLLDQISTLQSDKNRGFLTIFDGGAGGTAVKAHSDIEDITIFHVETAD